VQINPKNLPRREERNHINIVFLSNELQPLALDNSDRRYLVVYTPRMRDRPFYEKLKAWKDAGGVAALYDYLLAYPLDDFDPFAPAPITQAKLDLIDLNRKTPERFWIEWASGELDLPYRSCSIDQAYRAYLKYAQRAGDRFPMQKQRVQADGVRISEACSDTTTSTGAGCHGSHRVTGLPRVCACACARRGVGATRFHIGRRVTA
jgi:putative DNA primase/helicase